MAKYSDIKGFTVQTLSSDTAASGISAGSFASGGTMNTGRSYLDATNTMGTQTATLAVGGYPGTTVVANNESYNGSSWTEVGDLNQARSNGYGSGSTTAAFVGAGFNPPNNLTNTETWNGSAWTEVADVYRKRTRLTSSPPSRYRMQASA